MKFSNPFAKAYRIVCHDGTERIVYKKVNGAFPLYVDGYETNLAAKIKASSELDANVKGEYKTKIDGLLVAVDDYNNSIMMDFRAAYMVFTSFPCEKADQLERMVDRIMEKRNYVREIKLLLDSLITLAKDHPENRDDFFSLFDRISFTLAPGLAIDETQSQLRKSELIASRMAGRSN